MTTYRRNNANRDAGFTLIEILVVIVIIGLLAGMTTTVLVSARQSARSSVVASQMAQLSMALDDYKNKYGEYPPDFTDPEAVMRHVKKRWPRYAVADFDQFVADIAKGCKASSSIAPALAIDGQHVWNVNDFDAPGLSSLVFWLGGLPNADGKPSGFYANPRAPLGYYADGSPVRFSKAMREEPVFAFDRKNIGAYLVSSTPSPSGQNCVYLAQDDADWDASLQAYVYVPAFVQGDLPIVYFRPSANVPYEGAGGLSKAVFLAEDSTASFVTCAVPYARSTSNGVLSWFEEKRFQLVHPGVDGAFGPDELTSPRDDWFYAVLTDDTGYKYNVYAEDDDNVVNFATGGVLQTEYPE